MVNGLDLQVGKPAQGLGFGFEGHLALEELVKLCQQHPVPFNVHAQGGGNIGGEHFGQALGDTGLVDEQAHVRVGGFEVNILPVCFGADDAGDAPLFALFQFLEGVPVPREFGRDPRADCLLPRGPRPRRTLIGYGTRFERGQVRGE